MVQAFYPPPKLSDGLPWWRWFTWTCSSQDAQPACHHAAGELLPHLLTISVTT